MPLKRETIILIIAVACGLVAFVLAFNTLKNYSLAKSSPGKTSVVDRLEIPTDMRALALSNKEVENFPQQLRVGSYLDIMGVAPNYENQMEFQTIARATKIIDLERSPDKAIKAVTVALNPDATEVVAKAKSQAKIQLILRPDAGVNESLQLGGMGFVEVIRGVQKQKSIRTA